MTSELTNSLTQIVGTEHVLTGSSATPYYKDQRGNYIGTAIAIVFPQDTQQVSAVVAFCAAQNVSIIPQGGNTSLCGASVPLTQSEQLQVVINLSRLNRIRSVDPENFSMTVEAGCTLAKVREIASDQGRLFPLGLSAIESRCEIGGNISTNAGGIGVLRYGSMRDLVLGLEVVLPDGRIWNGLRNLRKDNTGYDLKHLFIGAEGTLGIITAAVLKLFPRPVSQATACVAIRDPATAVALLAHLRSNCGDRISAFEIVARPCIDLVLKNFPETREPFSQQHQWMVLIELADVLDMPLKTALDNALRNFDSGISEYLTTSDKQQSAAWWSLRKHISDAQKIEGVSIKHDVSVPISNVPAFLEQANSALNLHFPGIRIVAFGHIGDGNIHYNVSHSNPDKNAEFLARRADINRIVYDIVNQLKGSISAEHGLGQLKRDEIHRYKNELELELMRNIKKTLDPQSMMNPGKVF
jgi:FAD/FMN-containing dehydrogenase